jgi:hypothetical protein
MYDDIMEEDYDSPAPAQTTTTSMNTTSVNATTTSHTTALQQLDAEEDEDDAVQEFRLSDADSTPRAVPVVWTDRTRVWGEIIGVWGCAMKPLTRSFSPYIDDITP